MTSNPLLHREARLNTRQVVVDYVEDTITTTENGRVISTEPLSRNVHWRTLAEVRAFYERHDYKAVEDTEVGIVYEKPMFGRKPRMKFEHLPGCCLCEMPRYKKSLYCETHYREINGAVRSTEPRESKPVDKPQIAPGPTAVEIVGQATAEALFPDVPPVKRRGGRKARTQCPDPCGQPVYKNGLCIDHYRERAAEYKRQVRMLCKYHGCNGQRLRWKQFCRTHQDLFLAGKLTGSELHRKPSRTKTIVAVKPAAYDDPPQRWGSGCRERLPEALFDTGKDSPYEMLNFVCRTCETKKQPLRA